MLLQSCVRSAPFCSHLQVGLLRYPPSVLKSDRSCPEASQQLACRLLCRLDWSGLNDEQQDSLRMLAQLQCMATDPGEVCVAMIHSLYGSPATILQSPSHINRHHA